MAVSLSVKVSSVIHQMIDKWMAMSVRHKVLVLSVGGVTLVALAVGLVLRGKRRRYRSRDIYPSNSNHKRIGSFSSPLVPRLIIEDEDDNERSSWSGRRRLSIECVPMEDIDHLHHGGPPGDLFLSLSQAPPLSDDYFDATDLENPYIMSTTPMIHYLSDSDESFESAVDSIAIASKHQLYVDSLIAVNEGRVLCRTMRTKELSCTSDKDFLAKLKCVREALDDLISSAANKSYIIETGRSMINGLLIKAQQDPDLFNERYNDMINYCSEPKNWVAIETELNERGVMCVNIFDVAMDFMLLDAFDDLDNPPSTLVSVIHNGWISDSIKQSMLNTAVWSILKAKRSLLKDKNGFMSRFYLLSETITPVFAWGFLGNDEELRKHCLRFKMIIMKFLNSIFSLESVHYSSIQSLSDDIMNHITRSTTALTDSS